MKPAHLLLTLMLAALSGCQNVHSEADVTSRPASSDTPVTRVVVVGEVHGTNEIPDAFLSKVEHALKSPARPVVVAVELPPGALSDAKAVSRNCSRLDECAALLRTSPFWAKSRDGRSSQAYFRLVQALTRLEDQGQIQLIGVDLRKTGREQFGVLAGEVVASHLARPASRALVLVGSAHAEADGSGNSISSALRSYGYATSVLQAIGKAGAAWNCVGGECAVHPLPARACEASATTGASEESSLCIGMLTPSKPMSGNDVVVQP